MIDRRHLERLLAECRIAYKVKNEKLTSFSQRSIYTLAHGNNRLEVYETVSPIITVSLKGQNFAFAAAILFALELQYGRVQLVYLDKLGELQDLTAHFGPAKLTEADKQGLLAQHKDLGFDATVIDMAELEKVAEGYLQF